MKIANLLSLITIVVVSFAISAASFHFGKEHGYKIAEAEFLIAEMSKPELRHHRILTENTWIDYREPVYNKYGIGKYKRPCADDMVDLLREMGYQAYLKTYPDDDVYAAVMTPSGDLSKFWRVVEDRKILEKCSSDLSETLNN